MKKIGFGILLLMLAANLYGQGIYPKEKKKKWGYVNSQKKFVIKPVFEKAAPFKYSSAIVKTENNYSLINKKGEFLINEKYDTLRRSGSYVIYRLDTKFGILDSVGTLVCEPIFEKIDGYNGDSFTVKIDGRWVSWHENGEIREMENLVFVHPDEYPIFGSNCLDIKDKTERQECSNRSMIRTLYTNIKYPPLARNNGIEGTVVLRFLIKSEGTLDNFEILKDVGGGCGKEALRVAKLLKVVQPPIMEGKPVAMKYILPVKYRLH